MLWNRIQHRARLHIAALRWHARAQRRHPHTARRTGYARAAFPQCGLCAPRRSGGNAHDRRKSARRPVVYRLTISQSHHSRDHRRTSIPCGRRITVQ